MISHRRPRFTVNLGVIFQSSAAYTAWYGWRKPELRPVTPWLALSTAPSSKLANECPVSVKKPGKSVSRGQRESAGIRQCVVVVIIPRVLIAEAEGVLAVNPGEVVHVYIAAVRAMVRESNSHSADRTSLIRSGA